MCSLKFRKAFTLMELTVVLAVIGVIAVAATTMLSSRRVVSTVASKQAAEQLVATLRMARTTAILHGNSVTVVSDSTGFAVLDAAGQVLLPKHFYAPELDVSWTSSSIAFQPTGMADQSLQIRLVNEVKEWQIDVLSATGQALLTERLR